MTATVNFMIRIPEDLRNRAKAVAALRGETLSECYGAGFSNM